jgi:methyltransferase (TIGR00027 family)
MNPGVPSATAQLVATSIASSELEPELAPLLAPGMGSTSAALIQAGTRGFRMLAALVRRGWARALASAIETLTLPGIRAHYIVRKRWLEDVARKQIAGGVAQVVVIGAGFDTLAVRLHREFPAVHFVELDHPATQAAKQRGLEALRPGTNLELAPCDLTQSDQPGRALVRTSFQAALPTLFIAEGLLMYLRSEEMSALFQTVAGAAAPGSAFAFTFMERRDDGHSGFRGVGAWVNVWLRMKKEPFQSALRLSELDGFLARHGFQRVALADARTLREAYLSPSGLAQGPLAEGELLCLAELPTKPVKLP